MEFCRICCTHQNLKYTKEQLQQIYSKVDCKTKLSSSEQQLRAASAVSTLGNICHDCNDQLLNFDALDDDDLYDLDNSNVGAVNRPVIVDDDDLLYNLFHQKIDQRKHVEKKAAAVAASKCVNYELTQQSLGSDGDTEVIEVLTSSRESTPAAQMHTFDEQSMPLKGTCPPVVAIIDLENDEDAMDQKPGVQETRNQDAGKSQAKTERRRKVYAERELRLIASLSLVSSDSECEVAYKSTSTAAKKIMPVTSTSQLLKCKYCNVRLTDGAGMRAHMRSHAGNDYDCPVCKKQNFGTPQRLVHHIRCRHRSYDGGELSERPRHSNDSAMTIRLRYLERYTYYECQLCGRIDAILKVHNEHIMELHAAESRSLKDPMMKLLRCPLCKAKCGTQYVLLCSHLLKAHTPLEYSSYIREVRQLPVHDIWKAARQKDAYNTAKIYQYAQRKTYFLECRLCGELVAGFVHHAQHLVMHKRDAVQQPPIPKAKRLKALRKFKSTEEGISAKPKPDKEKRQRATTATRRQLRHSKVTPSSCKPTRTRMKVKAPLRQFPTQTYHCRLCSAQFSGFCRYNLHCLAVHKNEIASANRSALLVTNKRKRNFSTVPNSNGQRPLNASADIANGAGSPDHSTLPNIWLAELLGLHQKAVTINTAQRATPAVQAQLCLYCAKLFASTADMQTHVSSHLERGEYTIIRLKSAHT